MSGGTGRARRNETRRRPSHGLIALAVAVATSLLAGPAAAVDYTIVPGGPPLTVTVSVSGDVANARFNGTAGQRVSLEMTGVSIGTSACCGVKVTLLRPDGRVVALSTVGTNGGFLDTQTLPTTGTYTVAVDPQNASAGEATLVLYDVPSDTTTSIVAGGASVGIETTVPGQNATATFTGTAGQRVSLAIGDVTFGSTGCCTTRVSIVKPDGKTLASTTVGTTGGFLDTQTLPTTGLYKIFVDPQNAATGSATLTLYNVPADSTGTIVAGGPAVTVTTTTPGQNATLTFSGTSGQRVSAEIGPTCCSTRIVIVKPNGQTLTSANFGLSGGFFDAVVLPSSGTYTLIVDPQAAAAGAVTVRLYDVPADASASTNAGGPAVTVATSVPGQNAAVTFAGTAGQRVSIAIGPSCCSGRVSLLRPNGTSLVSGTFGTFGGFLDT